MPTPHYRTLVAKADAFFERVSQRHGAEMECQTGCSDCCHARLTITGVEAAAVRLHLATLSSELRTSLAARAATRDPRCPALDAEGRCDLYAARPLVCRTHGAPIRLPEAARRLPVVQSCHRNFRHGASDPRLGADTDCVLDQETMSTMLAAVDADHAARVGRSVARVALSAILTE